MWFQNHHVVIRLNKKVNVLSNISQINKYFIVITIHIALELLLLEFPCKATLYNTDNTDTAFFTINISTYLDIYIKREG